MDFSGDKRSSSAHEHSWDVGLPDDIELEIQLLDWLFALEGADGVAEPEGVSIKQDLQGSREDRCWHSTFRCLSLKAKGTKEAGDLAFSKHGTKSSPVQSLIVCVCPVPANDY